MKATENQTKKVLEGLLKLENKDEKTEKELITKLLGCVKQFFIPLHQFKSILKPLAELIVLGNIDHLHLEELNITNDKNYSPLLLQFFDQNDSENFMANKLINKNIAMQSCYEFLTIISVIKQNITDETMKTAIEFYKNSKKTKS